MKRAITMVSFLVISICSFGQMVMSAEGVNPEKVCVPGSVYFLMENRARPVESIDSIEVRLNSLVTFAKDIPVFTAKPAIQFAVNCRGENGGGFHIVSKSGNESLDNELIKFFKTITSWKAGKIKKKTVDSWYMWHLEIKNGYIEILN
jgi:hypothetical protein